MTSERSLFDRDLYINMEAGNDVVSFNNASVRDDLFIDMGSGSDFVVLDDMRIGNYGFEWDDNDLSIKTGQGADYVVLQYVRVRDDIFIDLGNGVAATARDNHDRIYLYSVDAGLFDGSSRFPNADSDLTINSGDGLDHIDLVEVRVRDDIQINTGSRRDVVRISDTLADEVNVYLGEGDDELTVQRTKARRALFVGDSGTDSFSDRGGNEFSLGRSGFERY